MIGQTDPFDGVIRDLPDDIYHAIEAFSSTFGKRLLRNSPAHGRIPLKPSPALTMGTLIHEVIFQPDLHNYRVLPDGANLGSNDGKMAMLRLYCEWLEVDAPIVEKQALGKMLSAQLEELQLLVDAASWYVVSQSDVNLAKECKDNLWRYQKSLATALLEDGGEAEVSGIWWDREYEIKCKARWDYLCRGNDKAFVDVKSIEDASFESIDRAINKFDYAFQMAHYIDGCARLGFGRRSPVFLFIEKSPPYHARFAGISQEYIAAGRQRVNYAKRVYAECMEKDIWPSYPDEILLIKKPKWY